MSKRVYISADYAQNSGDRDVVDILHYWGTDNKHQTDFVDTASVVSGSVSRNPDCRSCDLKAEFNRQINASSAVIIVIGDKTASRTAGSGCQRNELEWYECPCTPYKQNAKGTTFCKCHSTHHVDPYGDIGNINSFSYIRHEFVEAEQRGKNIIVVYNSFYRQPSWLPGYMEAYENDAQPFWIYDSYGRKAGNYLLIKNALGYGQEDFS